jgi:riboflavin synthase
VCLTVIRAEQDAVFADVGPETIRVTTLGSIGNGTSLNLERPLRADGRLGGHFVQGHVDGVGSIEAFTPERDFHWLTVSFPQALAPLMVHRGSIAVDGISLTIAGLSGNRFEVQIVPYTIQHTNLRRAKLNEGVNLECDLVGKYVVRAASLSGWGLIGAPPGEVTH